MADFKRQTITHPELWPHFHDLSQDLNKENIKKKYLQNLQAYEANIKGAKPKMFDSRLGIKNRLHKTVDNQENGSQIGSARNLETVDIKDLINKKIFTKEQKLPLINEPKKILKPAIFILEKKKSYPNIYTGKTRNKMISSATNKNITKKPPSYQYLHDEEISIDNLIQSCDNKAMMETPNIFQFKSKAPKKEDKLKKISLNNK